MELKAMCQSDEPNQTQLQACLVEDARGLASHLQQQSTVDELILASSSLGECHIDGFETFHALPNTNEVLIEIYDGDFKLLYDNIQHDHFQTSDAFLFLTIDSGVFTRSESDYHDMLQSNAHDLILGYCQAYVNGSPVMAIERWFDVINDYLNDWQQEQTS